MVSRDFDRDKRLLTARQFSAVFDSPTGKVPGKHVLLLARENGLDHPRLGLVIGKKNVKLAVQRNRLKRLIRESFRHNQETLAGWDIVVIAQGLGELENPGCTSSSASSGNACCAIDLARKALLTPLAWPTVLMHRSMPAHPDPCSVIPPSMTRHRRSQPSCTSLAYEAIAQHGPRRNGRPSAVSSTRLHHWQSRSRDLLLSVSFKPRPFSMAE